MHARTICKTAFTSFCALLTAFFAVLIIAELPSLTSAQSPSDSAIHESPSKKIVSSATKKKRALLAQAVATKPAIAPKLLPAVDKADITPHHRNLADKVLRALPGGCRDNLRNFFVQYKDVKNRGLGGKTTIILAGNVPDEEFTGLLTHECAHVIHSNLMGTSAGSKTTFVDGKDVFMSNSPIVGFFAISWNEENVLRAGAVDADFVSGYAEADSFEDFAETFAMYVLHRDALELRAKTNPSIAAKLEWMKTNLPMSSDVLGTSRYKWEKTVPWDITKLPLVLAVQK